MIALPEKYNYILQNIEGIHRITSIIMLNWKS